MNKKSYQKKVGNTEIIDPNLSDDNELRFLHTTKQLLRIQNARRMLECLFASKDWLGRSEIEKQCGLKETFTHTYLHEFAKQKLLEKTVCHCGQGYMYKLNDEGRKYVRGLKKS